MKKLFYALLLLAPAAAQAQISKGQVIGTVYLNSEYARISQGQTLNPAQSHGAGGELGVFVRDGLALGLSADVSGYQYKTENSAMEAVKTRTVSRTGSAGLFLRKYWNISPFLIYGGGGVGITSMKSGSSVEIDQRLVQDQELKNFIVSSRAQLGVIYPVSKRIGLELAAESQLFPFSFNNARLGLVILSGQGSGAGAESASESLLSKGRWLLAGGFSTDFTESFSGVGVDRNTYKDKSTRIELAPAIFVQERLLVGLSVYANFGIEVNSRPRSVGYVSREGQKPFSIGVRPFVKKYLSPSRLSPYVEVYASYDRVLRVLEGANTYNAGGSFGLAYTLGKNWLAEAQLVGLSGGYSKLNEYTDDTFGTFPASERFGYDLQAGFRPSFKVAYIFR